MNKSTDHEFLGCMSKDERITTLKANIKSLEDSLADANEMKDFAWEQTKL